MISATFRRLVDAVVATDVPPRRVPSFTSVLLQRNPQKETVRGPLSPGYEVERERAYEGEPACPRASLSGLPAEAPAPAKAVIAAAAPEVMSAIAWGAAQPIVRVEISKGRLAGASVTVESDEREVRVAVEGVSENQERALRARIGRRLGARGYALVE